ncbi:hypothetical protein JRQ81_015333 [Phrynocephalus forsythii]|uniref:Acrosin-binding protein n=1 Tax=Phrynocephalus forsythii TaxID=171643 RepID=A0A9Q0XVQ1_9SAUR|nr:hypothetical protein JRQ81_015333 [Phrynocephalus forsythii]
MRWPHKATQGFLFNLALLKWLFLVGTEMLEQVGTPLSDAEYKEFFETFNDPHRVGAVCFLRAVYGCKQPLIQMLDRYENHGILPKGRVCSSSRKRPNFPDFCTFTLYRCAMRKYFMKRVLCPGETVGTSNDTLAIDQKIEPLHNLSFILQSLPMLLHSSPPTLTNTNSGSESPIGVVNALSISAAVVMEVSPDSTTSVAETSSAGLSSPAESVLHLLFHTTTKKESIEVLTESPLQSLTHADATTDTDTDTDVSEPLPEVHSATPTSEIAEPEFSPEQHTTSVPAAAITLSASETETETQTETETHTQTETD